MRRLLIALITAGLLVVATLTPIASASTPQCIYVTPGEGGADLECKRGDPGPGDFVAPPLVRGNGENVTGG